MKGVTDCRVSTGLISHPKKLKLQRRLGKQAVWSLIALWSFAASNRPDGSLAGMTAEDIAIAADWDGDPDAFVGALLELHLVDGEAGQITIHDWAENNPWAAGSSKRSEDAKIAALIKHHGKDAARMLIASGSHAGRTAEVTESLAPRMPVASEAHAESANPQCPVSASVSDSESLPNPSGSGTPSAVSESREPSPANAVSPLQAERTVEEQQLLPSSPAAGRAAPARTVTLEELIADGLDRELAAEWLAHRKQKRAPLTPRAWSALKREAGGADYSPAQAVSKALAMGWQGFEASWLRRDRPSAQPRASAPDPYDVRIRMEDISV